MASVIAVPRPLIHEPRLERRPNEPAGISAKAATSEVAFQSALATLANPLHAPSGAVHPLFQAFGAVAQATGITLKRSTSAAGQTLEGIALASGVRLRRVRLRGDWWKRDAGPLLASRGGRPVALLPLTSGRYRAVDPITAVPILVNEQAAADIDPHAHILYGGLDAVDVSLAGLVRYALGGSFGDLLRVLASNAAAGALGLAAPLLIAWLAGSVIPAGDRGQLLTLVGGLAIAAICSGLFSLHAALALQRASIRSSGRVMAAVWNRLLMLPASFFRQFSAADLTLRAISVDRAREALAGAFLTGAMGCAFSLLHVTLLVHFAPAMTLPAVALAGAISALSAVCGWLLLRRQTAIAQSEARTAGRTLEFVQGVAKLRSAGAEERAFASWAHAFARGRRESIGARRISIAVTAFQAAVPLVGWTLIAALATADSSLRAKPAVLLAFSASFQQLLVGALQLSGFFVTWAEVSALASRAKPLLACLPEMREAGIDPGPLNGGLEVRDLTFRYEPFGPSVLREVSFRVEPGEFVAFVGSSGSGKSTLLRLLIGFERAESGSIFYDGRDLANLAQPAVRRQLGVVLQNGRLLAGDIASNILGATGLGLEAAWKAAELAGIADEIRALPMGMRTQVSDNGAGFSGGQRQRILLARALVHSPRIVLLDEATSSLDNRTQAAVAAGLERLGATRIVIAHRLSTIRHADRIFVLEAGQIVESGSFEELWERGGRFRELARLNLCEGGSLQTSRCVVYNRV